MYKTFENERNGSMSQRERGHRLVDRGSWPKMQWKVPWRSLHVIISVLTIVFGFCTFLPLGYVSKYFLQQCLLYSDINFIYFVSNSTAVVNFPSSVWGEQTKCYYVTFTSVAASIHAFVWGWFFLLMKQAFHRKNHEFSMLIPSLLFHGVLFVVVFISSCYINEGIDVWCKNFYRHINTFPVGRKMTCKDSQTIYWNIFKGKQSFYTFLSIARISTWLLTLCILLQCIVCVYQMYIGIKEGIKEIERKSWSHGQANEGFSRQFSRSDNMEVRFISSGRKKLKQEMTAEYANSLKMSLECQAVVKTRGDATSRGVSSGSKLIATAITNSPVARRRYAEDGKTISRTTLCLSKKTILNSKRNYIDGL